MKILYFGSACDKEWFEEASTIKAMPAHVAQYRFEMALITGFSARNDIDMDLYYLYQEPYYPKGKFLKFYSRKKKINKKYFVTYISNINLPLFKEINFFIKAMIITLKWHIKNRKANEKMVLTSFNYSPLSLGILIISKLFGIKRANFFTDLSTDIINNKRQKDIVFIKRILLPLYLKLVKYIESNYDLYILFTKPMNTRVNPKNKPYLVMEGIYNNELELSKVQKKKAIMYAGTLSHEYGIKNILDAFEQLEDNEIELWLFGDGDMKKYINDICLRDQRIQFFGFRPHEEVFKYEKMATLLINVRNSDEEYTAYSFPSKTFEYMVSGTPFLTTKLKGIPEEYYSYLYTIESTNATSLKHKIEEIFTKPEYELKNFGLRAREFILNEKNSDIQAKRIVEFIREKFECVE